MIARYLRKTSEGWEVGYYVWADPPDRRRMIRRPVATLRRREDADRWIEQAAKAA